MSRGLGDVYKRQPVICRCASSAICIYVCSLLGILLLLHGINLERPERTLYVRGGISENVPNPMQETGRFRLYVDVLFPEIRLFSFLGNRRLFCQPVRNIDDLNALILVRFISDPGEYQLRISVLDLKKGVYFALKGFLVADVV